MPTRRTPIPGTTPTARSSKDVERHGWALWYYRGRPPPFLQVVWPDRRGAFPWEPACGQRCREDQPATWRLAAEQPAGPWRLVAGGAAWSFPAPRHAEALVTGRIVSGSAPVLGVVHDDEGDWWFVDDGPAELEDFAVVHLGHVVDEHPVVAELGDLPWGWEAWREEPDGPWEREPSEPEG